MSILFETFRIKNVEIRNRFVRSGTGDFSATKMGRVSERQIKIYEDLALGGVGLIITGIHSVHNSGRLGYYMNSISSDECIPGLKRLTSAVHNRGARIAVQLFHAGREAGKLIKTKTGETLAPSFVADDPYFKREHRPMTESEIWELIHAFGDAAKRAREANFDAVQLHGAHAYIFSQFLSPHTNRRGDNWGGGLLNRLRFHKEVYRDIKAKVGDDYPILIKLGVQDGRPGGLELSEGKCAAELLEQWGYDSLEISQGIRGKEFEETEFRTKIGPSDRKGYFREWSKIVKRCVNIPVMLVGGLRSIELMEAVVENQEADFVSLCRPFIREPDLVNKWKKDRHYKAKCISCNGCLQVLRKLRPLYCLQEKA